MKISPVIHLIKTYSDSGQELNGRGVKMLIWKAPQKPPNQDMRNYALLGLFCTIFHCDSLSTTVWNNFKQKHRSVTDLETGSNQSLERKMRFETYLAAVLKCVNYKKQKDNCFKLATILRGLSRIEIEMFNLSVISI